MAALTWYAIIRLANGNQQRVTSSRRRPDLYDRIRWPSFHDVDECRDETVLRI
jgi:hypothetical protein